ncbi:MAG TPA: imidazole glycerol phosphate synthase subunit HisH [Gammaproteobacteria bacterium]|nr:imidazole glycerol phosphate synthase subunit HisH [Gammaproteobacteria bacterium]
MSRDRVAVIDYGMGNLRSVSQALAHAGVGYEVVVTADADVIRAAERVVFPGVGALRDCLAEVRRLGLEAVIRECLDSRPFLGICLGMQALLDFSEENEGTPALGVVAGRVLHFSGRIPGADEDGPLKIPHMGWNRVHQTRPHPLWEGIPQDGRFYFVHSYFVEPEDPSVIAATTEYGLRFTSALARDNVFAVQFHPEKSQHLGLRLLANFLRWDGTL